MRRVCRLVRRDKLPFQQQKAPQSHTWLGEFSAHDSIEIHLSSIKNRDVAAAFDSYPPKFRRKLLVLRRLVLKTAKSTEGVGKVEETLKWGEPAYLTSESKSGSTIRIAWKRSSPTQYAMYFHCQTNLVETFRELFPGSLRFEGNRAIVFGENDKIPVDEVSFCIAAALTYHRTKASLRV